jgi:hypothetical protein
MCGATTVEHTAGMIRMMLM